MHSKFRTPPQIGFNFGELVIDSFAGGGGASTGIEAALGRPVDIAINHDPQAIAMHTINHPQTRHYCESVWQVDPREVCQGRPVGFAWFSPDCTHHSKARGGKPRSRRVRGLAWNTLKWAGLVRPRVIGLENVEEFEDWGPLTRSQRPCKKRKGLTFQKFVSQLQDLGYTVDWQQLRACDYGVPTIRKRLFLVARCDGLPVVWPEPTHGPGLLPYRTAADIIDWSIPCPSIFTRKRPLVENTLRRIARGIQKFVIDNPTPFVVPEHANVVQLAPFLTEHANGSGQRVFSAEEPLRTQVASIKGGHFALVSAFLAKHYGGNYTGAGQSLGQPVSTITTKDHHALVSAFLIKYYGTGSNCHGLDQPLSTLSTRDRMGLVMVRGEPYQIVDIGMRMLEPHELYAAQGFPADYIIDRDATGARITKEQQVAKCGNSVCPPVAEALVRANMQTAAMPVPAAA